MLDLLLVLDNVSLDKKYSLYLCYILVVLDIIKYLR